jgi:FMN phosphatase YigB (HAD superfamily)
VFGASKFVKAKMLVCDLDNTLYDWVSYFVPSLYMMIHEATKIMRCDQEELCNDLRSIHQHYHNTEHPYSLLETATYRKWASGKNSDARNLIDPAFYAFNSSRKKLLQLYPTVSDTLELLQNSGVIIVAYSDSGYFAVLDRVRRLNIEDRFDKIYCSPRADDKLQIHQNNDRWVSNKICELPQNSKKPNPSILRNICLDQGVDPVEALYIGDSLTKDIWMAKQAGLFAVWAKFGTVFDSDFYQKLVRISHWNAEDIKKESAFSIAAAGVKPDFVCEDSFSNILRTPVLAHIHKLSDQHSAA